jgi:succinyl-diaminopimelate desuccinylase
MTSKEIIEQTKRLIAIRSTRDNPEAVREAMEFVENIVKGCPNVTIERFERDGCLSFLAYRGKTRPVKFDILLNGHVDVVAGSPGQFKPVEKNGRLYGRGALDMKGTTLVLTDVFCEMVNKVPYSLGLQIVSDEEIGGYNGVRLQIDQGVRAEFVIMGEYSNHRNTVYNAARGLCWAEIAFKGKDAHGGHLWHGDNAVIKAGNFAGAVLKRFPTPNQETWTTTASIASLSTPNDTYNKVPDRAVLKVDFRFTQEDPVFQSEETVRTFIAGIDPDAELVNLAVFEPAVRVEELNPYTQGLSNAVRSVTKAKPHFLGRPAASDGRHYALFNIDIVEFGLYGQRPHSDEEYVELDSFGEYRAIMRAFLRKPIPAHPKQKHNDPLHQRLLQQLVSLPTVTGDEATTNTAFTFVEDFLRKRGMHIQSYRRNGFRSFVATTKPDNRQPAVLLNAHMDVVPAPANLFKVTRRGDKLFGRGVMDMKFAIASYMAVVDSLKDELSLYDFGIMVTSDEEVGSKNGTIPLLKDYGYRPNVVVIPDSGENWQLETFAKGIHWIKLTAKGKPGHASRQWEGDSAIRRLLGAINEIELLIPADVGPEDTTLSVGTIEGGSTANQIPTHASAVIDIRYGSMDDYKQLFPRIKTMCKKHGVTATVIATGQPSINDPEDGYIRPFTEIVKKVTGEQHEYSMSYGVTDGRHFSEIGVPCVVIQPPAGDRHKDTEWLSRKGFDQFTVVLDQYVRKMSAIRSEEPAKEKDLAHLARRLNTTNKPAYVWYATFGSGLCKENFLALVSGGAPKGARHVYRGCRDKTLPLKDMFMSLPYELYFSGESLAWAGGHAVLDTKRTTKAHTVARAYLITIEQFEDIIAQENLQDRAARLPLSKAIHHGHAPIDNLKDIRVYDELLYCGEEEGIPVFSLTSRRPRLNATPPPTDYTRFLCKGLSQNPQLSTEAAVNYLASRPGIVGHYKKQTLTELFNEEAEEDN